MADNNILAGRLTVDVEDFTSKISNAVKAANKEIARVAKETGGGSGNATLDKQTQQYKAMQQEVKHLAEVFKNYNDAVKAANQDGMAVFSRRIEESKGKINQYYTELKTLNTHTEKSTEIHKKAAETYQKAQTIIQNQAKKTAEAQTKAQQAAEKAAQQLGKQVNATIYRTQLEEIKKVATAYKDLKASISEYNKAKQVGDTQGMQYWRQQIDASHQVLEATKTNIDELGLEESQRRKVLNIIQQGSTAMMAFNQVQTNSQILAEGLANQWTKIWGVMKLLSGFSIYKVFSEATNYAMKFDAAMTDIDVITKGTTVSTAGLGGAYRKLANDLRVSSTEIAQANATIFRQGFTDSADAQAVTVGATKFGAVTGIGTASAIQNMTAAIQNFREENDDIGEFVMHLGDVWSYMGDTVATTGQEISAAMAKTSASIRSVGVSLEQASSWAAIMLAKTQQSGQVIGTNLNSLVARYAKVTSKGYAAVTSDDEGEALSFNDVSKALAAAGIKMYNVATQTFLPMNEMMDQLAAKWDTLDEAQRKYIATTLGGTRGMNYLLTLLDNYNDALELEAGIVDGIVDSKYEAWMNGVQAAQNNLTNSMENLYSYMSRDLMTGFYNGLAGLVDMFVDATDAVGGLNLKLPLVAAGIMAIVSAIMHLKNSYVEKGLIGIFSGNSIGIVVAGLAAIATLVGKIVAEVNRPKVNLDELNSQISASNAKIEKWGEISKDLDELSKKTSLTNEEMETFVELRKKIVDDSPYLQYVYGKEGEEIESTADALKILNDERERDMKINKSRSGIAYGENRNTFLTTSKNAYGYYRPGLLDFDLMTEDSQQMLTYLNIMQGKNWDPTKDNPNTILGTVLDFVKSNHSQTIADYQIAKDILTILADSYDLNGLELTDRWDEASIIIDDNIAVLEDQWKQAISEIIPGMVASLYDYDAYSTLMDIPSFTSFLMNVMLTNKPQTDADMKEVENLAKQAGDLLFEAMQNGLSSDWLNNVGNLYGSNPQFINSFGDMFDGLMSDYSKAYFNMSFSEDFMPATQKAFANGISVAVLQAINTAFEAVAASGLEGDDLLGAKSLLLDSILTYLLDDPEGLKQFAEDYTIALPVNVKPLPSKEDGEGGFKEAEEDAQSYADTIRAAINDTKELQQAIDAINNNERIDDKLAGKLVSAYPQLKEALQTYADAITANDFAATQEAKQTLLDMMEIISHNSEGIAGIEQIETIMGYMEKLASGEYNVKDIEAIINLLGITMEDLKDLSPEELMNKLNDALKEQVAQWGDVAQAMGIVLDQYKSFSEQVEDVIHPLSSAENAIKKLTKDQQLSVSEISELIRLYPDLADELSSYGRDTSDVTNLVSELNRHVADDAMNAWVNSVETAVKKIEDAKTGTKDYTNAIIELSNAFDFQGMGQLENLDFVTANLDNIRAAAHGSAEAFRELQEAAWVNILGTSNIDFSNIENGIALVGEDAQRLGQLLTALGYFEVETKQITSAQEIISGMQGNFMDGFTLTKSAVTLGGTYQVLKPAAGNPFAARGIGTTSSSSSNKSSSSSTPRSSSSSSPRSSSSGSETLRVSDRTQSMLDGMSETQNNFANRLKLIQLKNEYHDIRGELQGVIGYTRLEADTITQQNKALEENIKKLDDEIAAKKEIIARNHSSSTTYKQAAVDLAELNKTHKDYTEQLQSNKNRLESLRKELDKLDEEARQSTITVQELIRKTIVDQKQHERDMLEGTIALEDKILDVIQKRYERERDLAIETANAKKDALQEEIDKIDEAIDARRKLLEKEDKSKEIAELQAKIARISTDPTRRKEAMQLEAELAEKQKELAWDTYEEELNAQKDSLDKQMDNIDDYIDYVREYYEDLFEHPKKLIAEMQDVIQRSDTEIVDWLKANSEEWADYTDAKRQKTEEDWLEMVHNMRGVSETYQKEIEEIMSWTDAEIIEWLKKNNVEFKNATKEQQDSFLYSWKESLNNWRNAYKNIVAEINATTYSAPTVTYSGGGGYSGGTSYSGGTTYSGGGYSGGTYASTPVSTPASSSSSSGGSSSGGYQISQYGNTSLFTAAAQEYSQPTSYTAYAKWGFYRPNGQYDYEQEWQTGAYANRGTLKETAKNIAKVRAYNRLKDEWYDAAFRSHTKSVADYKEAMKYINSGNNSAYLWLEQSYKKGGIADFTGPAWLDGTPSAPERVLSAEQTALFETLVKSLQAIKTVSVSGLSGGGDMSALGGANISIEQILIQPQSLDEDADYDLIAERVGQSIMDGLNRTMAIGGIRI